MKVEVKKKVWKEAESLPAHIKLLVDEQIEKLKTANSLSDLDNAIPMKGTNEPYYRLKFSDYRIIIYYDETTNTVDVRKLSHRKDVYKKHNLPWR
jgi:mRNA-degrading endonuclease RelE of RelBE toxin-antitoxin system